MNFPKRRFGRESLGEEPRRLYVPVASRLELVPIRAEFPRPFITLPSLLMPYATRPWSQGRARKEGFFLENSTSHVCYTPARPFSMFLGSLNGWVSLHST